MLRLILMRHAKSDWSHPGLGDHERPLNKRGQGAAVALGNWIRDAGYLPDQVLCSTARRTRQTLNGLALTPAPKASFSDRLYLAEARAMLEILNDATGACVLMIGHNPGICELAHRLVADPPPHERFADYPTGATLVCDFDAAQWQEVDVHAGTAVDFVTPHGLINPA